MASQCARRQAALKLAAATERLSLGAQCVTAKCAPGTSGIHELCVGRAHHDENVHAGKEASVVPTDVSPGTPSPIAQGR